MSMNMMEDWYQLFIKSCQETWEQRENKDSPSMPLTEFMERMPDSEQVAEEDEGQAGAAFLHFVHEGGLTEAGFRITRLGPTVHQHQITRVWPVVRRVTYLVSGTAAGLSAETARSSRDVHFSPVEREDHEYLEDHPYDGLAR
jgi:hypothetical protein